jgi:ABC-type multidrug transport system, ATPase and permease components
MIAKRLAKCIEEYKKESILAPIMMLGEVSIEIAIPFFMARIVDIGMPRGDRGYIWRTGLLLILLALGAMFFGVMSGYFAAKASAGLAKNIRQEIYYNIQKFSFSNIDKFSTSSLVTRLTTDITNVQMSYQLIVRTAVRGPLMLIFSFIMVYSINPQLSWIFLIAMPLLAVGLVCIIRKVHPVFERVFQIYDRLNKVVQENLRGIRVVKSYVREEYEIEKFKGVSRTIYKDFSKAEKILALNGPMMQVVMYSSMLAIFWLGSKLIVGGSLETGQLMSLFTYLMQSLISLMMLSMVFAMITISQASAERIVEVLNEKSTLQNGENPVLEVENGSIEFTTASFSYKENADKFCLEDISFSLKSGESLGILGGTGSAKSSLVQLIPRLYDATEGSIKVGGIDVKNYDLETLRNAVAIVLQKNVLFSGTIRQNLHWGNQNATEEELIHACKLAQAHDFIMGFPDGYDTYIEQGGSNVSGGQKQRLCIARALLKKPKILILDDSTSAVDTKTDIRLQEAFQMEIPNITKITIAQRISSIEKADKIILLDGGKIEAMGTHEELLELSEIYKEVYYSQKKGGEENGQAE